MVKKRTDTGGLPTHLTIAESAYVRLTSNIDVTDGLANGVRGIIRKIIINEDSSVNAILVKFDNKEIGKKAKSSSQYKTICQRCCPNISAWSFIPAQEYYNISQPIPSCTVTGKYNPFCPGSNS